MARAVALFVAAALAEIGGAYLVWVAMREGRGLAVGAAGGAALALYGLLAAQQSDPSFGRVLAAYGGVFVAGSLLWGVIADGFRPDARDLAGAALCLLGAGVIMAGRT